MARQEKGTRARGTPPRLRLQEQDAHSGSFPTKFRTVSDNRTGNYPIFFDDRDGLNFNQSTGYPVVGHLLNENAPEHEYFAGNNCVFWWLFDTGASTSGFVASFDYGNGSSGDTGLWEQSPAPPPFTPLPAPNGSSADVPYSTPIGSFPNSYSAVLDGAIGKCYVDGNTPAPAKINSNLYNILYCFSFSISVWVKITTGGAVLSMCNPYTATTRDYILRITSTGRVEFWVYDDFNSDRVARYSTAGAVTPGVWANVIVTIGETNPNNPVPSINIFVNGINVSDTTIPPFGFFTGMNGTSYHPTIRFNAGVARDQTNSGQEYYDGKLDDITIFSKILSQKDIDFIVKSKLTAFGILYPALVNTREKLIEKLFQTESDFFSGNISDRILTAGSLRKGISDNFVSFTQGQELQPFRDNGHPELDGMISSSTKTPNPFYATGSVLGDVGPGFQQPLWSKSKFEIDISIGSDVSFGHRSGSGEDRLMVYYDHGTKTYNPVGSEIRMDQDFPSLANWYYKKAIGFSGISNQSPFDNVPVSKVAGGVVDAFGFPFSSRYYVSPTSSILYPLSGVLSEPFLLEKITVEFSASVENIEFTSGFTAASAYGTFFLLNQRGGPTSLTSTPLVIVPATTDGLKAISNGVGALASVIGLLIPIQSSDAHPSGSMDIVSVLQFGTGSSTNPDIESARARELMFGLGSAITNGYTTGFSIMSGTVKSPTKNSFLTSYLSIPSNYQVIVPPIPPFTTPIWFMRNNYGGRTGNLSITGRNWKQLLATEELGGSISGLDFLSQKIWQNNPYLLLPTDKLIIGWQSPLVVEQDAPAWTTSYGPKMTLAAGTYKVTLYGSHLKVGEDGELEETHDTLNQLFSSNTIHETIG